MRSRKRYFMTNREFYTAISNGEMNDELMAKATELIEKMNETNAKRAQKVLEKKQAAEDEKAPIRKALLEAADEMIAVAVKPDGGLVEFRVRLGAMTDAERQILADGCLINYYKNH